MALKDKTEPAEELEWTAEEEIQLFFALDGLKPVGIDRNFKMISIWTKMCKALNREISSETIWTHLRTLYNLEALDEMEPLPFPNFQKDFDLPESEFSTLLAQRKKDAGDDKEEVNIKLESTPTTPVVTTTGPKAKSVTPQLVQTKHAQLKDLDKKVAAKLLAHADGGSIAKRTQKRTRGSTSVDSPSTTPPPSSVATNKRRRKCVRT